MSVAAMEEDEAMAGKPHRKKGKGRFDKPIEPVKLPSYIRQALGDKEADRIEGKFTEADQAAAERETAEAIAASIIDPPTGPTAPELTALGQHAAALDESVKGNLDAIDQAIAKFTEALKPPPPPKPADRWAWPVLTVALVTCVLAAALWLNRRTIMDLQGDVISLGRRYHMALVDKARIQGIAEDREAALYKAAGEHARQREENEALSLQSEANVERWSDDEASMHAASRDLQHATAVLQRAQDADQFDDRGPMTTVLRALERAEKRLRQ
jgi:hypothetical protein